MVWLEEGQKKMYSDERTSFVSKATLERIISTQHKKLKLVAVSLFVITTVPKI